MGVGRVVNGGELGGGLLGTSWPRRPRSQGPSVFARNGPAAPAARARPPPGWVVYTPVCVPSVWMLTAELGAGEDGLGRV